MSGSWWPVLLLFGALARSSSAAGAPTSRFSGDLPRRASTSLRARYQSPAVRAVWQRFGPRYLPGVPLSAFVALSASSVGPRELGGPPDYVRGELNVERSYRAAHAGDATTRADLGRAIGDADAPQWYGDTEGQWYLGLRRYSDALDAAARATRDTAVAVPTAEQAAARGLRLGPWAYALAVASYSTGAGTIPRLAAAVAERLAGSADPWAELARLVVAELARGGRELGGVQLRGPWHAAHGVMRVEGRLDAGRALAHEFAQGEEGWYPPPLTGDVRRALSAAARG